MEGKGGLEQQAAQQDENAEYGSHGLFRLSPA
jgi:hypothetical protein